MVCGSNHRSENHMEYKYTLWAEYKQSIEIWNIKPHGT
jgi:hypothetical protein